MITLHSRVSKQMVNYELGKIYKLVCNNTELIYIGSTCQKLLSQRLSGHVADYKRWKNGKGNYVTSFKIIEGGDYYMELLEAVTCSSFDDLAKKERHYIESIDCVNKIIPGRTNKEYQQDNKEKLKVYKKQLYSDNKEEIKCSKCWCRVMRRTLPRHQQTLKCQNAAAKVLVKVKCTKCGSVVVQKGLLRHQRTLKCQNAADILQELDEITN